MIESIELQTNTFSKLNFWIAIYIENIAYNLIIALLYEVQFLKDLTTYLSYNIIKLDSLFSALLEDKHQHQIIKLKESQPPSRDMAEAQ